MIDFSLWLGRSQAAFVKEKREQGEAAATGDRGDFVEVGTGEENSASSWRTVEMWAVFGKAEMAAFVGFV